MSSRWQRSGLAAVAGSIIFLSSTLVSGLLGASCTTETTAQKRVSLATQIVADDAVDAPIVNAYGWSLQLSRIALSMGPLYYWNGSPAVARATPPDPFQFLRIASAYAHPGHYVPGDAMGQMLQSSSVDLALGEATLPVGEGVSGVYRSARFTFEEKPVGGAVEALGGHIVVLEGTGKKDTLKRVFRAEFDIADILDAASKAEVEGCAFQDAPDVQADGTVTVHVVPSVWLDQLELDAVPESMDGKPVLLARDSVAFRALDRGLKKASAFIFEYTTP